MLDVKSSTAKRRLTSFFMFGLRCALTSPFCNHFNATCVSFSSFNFVIKSPLFSTQRNASSGTGSTPCSAFVARAKVSVESFAVLEESTADGGVLLVEEIALSFTLLSLLLLFTIRSFVSLFVCCFSPMFVGAAVLDESPRRTLAIAPESTSAACCFLLPPPPMINIIFLI